MTWESKGSRSERDYFVEIDVGLMDLCDVERNGATEEAKGAEKPCSDDYGSLEERNRGRYSAFSLVTNSSIAFVCSIS